MSDRISAAQEYLSANAFDGWLLRDYFDANPILWNVLGGHAPNMTRPCWLFIPAVGRPTVLAHSVDAGRFKGLWGTDSAEAPIVKAYANRDEMITSLQSMIPNGAKVAMEYSPMGQLPRVGRVDAGSVELVRSFGADVVGSGDVIQYATERWTDAQLESHRYAAERLTRIVKEAFKFVQENINWRLTEHDVAEFIRGRFQRSSLWTDEGPVVAVNENSSDAHYEPKPDTARVLRRGSWLLIDLWARRADDPESIFADITWTAYLGSQPSEKQKGVFDAVRDGRDAAVAFIEDRFAKGDPPQGYEVDRVARELIEGRGFGEYFVHRLGHSLGVTVHSNAVNLDDWETRDTRTLLPGLGVTVEPGVYLPEFGVRSEIDVYLDEDGPEVTTNPQKDIYPIEV